MAMHHPFTAPNPEDIQDGNGAGLRGAHALAYDLVYNGVEVAGVLDVAACLGTHGDSSIHDSDVPSAKKLHHWRLTHNLQGDD